ncbi:MAG: CHASE2 domain-containing protein [Alphaproteobacteria bacterium]
MADPQTSDLSKNKIVKALRDKGLWHWLVVLGILLLAFIVRPLVYSIPFIADAQDRIFRLFISATPRERAPTMVRIVLIKDQEFWNGELEGRTPTKRDYIAKIVRRLDELNASVVALDFDLHLSDPNAAASVGNFSLIPKYLVPETDELVKAIREVAERRPIVLANKVDYVGDNHSKYRLEPNIYQLYGLCTGFDDQGRWQNPGTPEHLLSAEAERNVSCGYINLDFKKHSLLGRLPLTDGRRLSSFAFAIARAINPEIAPNEADTLRYMGFIPAKKYTDKIIVSSGELFSMPTPELLRRLQFKAVIVGGSWSRWGVGRGPQVDTYDTFVGPMVGAVLHHNYAEAFIDKRLLPLLPEWAVVTLEVMVTVAIAVLFALISDNKIRAAMFVVIVIALFALQWAMLVFGMVFEAFVPVLFVFVHSYADRLREKHKETSGSDKIAEHPGQSN